VIAGEQALSDTGKLYAGFLQALICFRQVCIRSIFLH